MADRTVWDPGEMRRFDARRDRRAVVGLWDAALGDTWPVLPDAVDRLGMGYVIERRRQMVGMIATDPLGSIVFVAVHPEHRRQGYGTRLVEQASTDFRAAGVGAITLGSGGDRYIWPGVPTNCPEAIALFDRLGWPEVGIATDLVQDLRDPLLPGRLAEAVPPRGIELSLASPRHLADVIAFEDDNFPQWSRYFREPNHGVLVARGSHGDIVGSLLLDGPGRAASAYWPLLGDDCAAIGCVGVTPALEGRGIGTAMVAMATQVLAERGAGPCIIDWVVRVAFYQRLGYEPWRGYSMRRRSLAPAVLLR